MSGVVAICVSGCDCSVVCSVAATSVWTVALDSVVVSGVVAICVCGCDCSVACSVAVTSAWTVVLDSVAVSGVDACPVAATSVWTVVLGSVVCGGGVVRLAGFLQAMPYGTCWGSWFLAIPRSIVALNPPTKHMSPCFAFIGNMISTFETCSLLRIPDKVILFAFISPPMRNLPSLIGLFALMLELLCSNLSMSCDR